MGEIYFRASDDIHCRSREHRPMGYCYYNRRNVNGDRTGDARILLEDNVYRHMVASGERPEWYESMSANAGFDYKLSAKSTFSGSYFYGNRTEGRSAFYIYNDFYADKNKISIPGVNRREAWIYIVFDYISCIIKYRRPVPVPENSGQLISSTA